MTAKETWPTYSWFWSENNHSSKNYPYTLYLINILLISKHQAGIYEECEWKF